MNPLEAKQPAAYNWMEAKIIEDLRNKGVIVRGLIRVTDNCASEFKSLSNLALLQEPVDYTRLYVYKPVGHGKSRVDALHGHIRKQVVSLGIEKSFSKI